MSAVGLQGPHAAQGFPWTTLLLEAGLYGLVWEEAEQEQVEMDMWKPKQTSNTREYPYMINILYVFCYKQQVETLPLNLGMTL